MGKIKNLVVLILAFTMLSSFQSQSIDKILQDINARFKNMEVSLINWPEDLQQNLGGLKKTAFLALPKNKSNKKLPLLITLHGAGGKTWSLEEQLERSSKVKGLWLAEKAGKEIMLVEPNTLENWDHKTLNIMLDYLLEQYPQIDSNRIYIMGHSMGGKGTWDWILHSPERFAAAVPCGFSGVSDADEVNKLKNLPVWGMVGGNDIKNLESVKKMVNLLIDTGNTNVKYTVFPQASHVQGNEAVFNSVDCIDWMLNFTRTN